MNRRDLQTRVREIIADELSVDVRVVTPETRFLEDLGADSLDVVEMVMRFEEEFELEIADSDAEQMSLVGDAPHTPGPWHVKPNGYNGEIRIYNAEGAQVARAFVGNGGDGAHGREMRLANGHLIAAAPELLDALETVTKLFEPDCKEGEHAQIEALRAISKARGDA